MKELNRIKIYFILFFILMSFFILYEVKEIRYKQRVEQIFNQYYEDMEVNHNLFNKNYNQNK